jgi:hypothetical protein
MIDDDFDKHLDKIMAKWLEIDESMREYTSKYRDEHWESLIQTHLDGKDMSNDLYNFLRDELNGVFDRCHLKYNMLNLFEMEEDELEKTHNKSIDLLYNLLTKVTTTIIVFNKMEKYEESKVLHTQLKDLYILVNCGISLEYTPPELLAKEFYELFEKTTDVISQTKYFTDYINK